MEYNKEPSLEQIYKKLQKGGWNKDRIITSARRLGVTDHVELKLACIELAEYHSVLETGKLQSANEEGKYHNVYTDDKLEKKRLYSEFGADDFYKEIFPQIGVAMAMSRRENPDDEDPVLGHALRIFEKCKECKVKKDVSRFTRLYKINPSDLGLPPR